MLQRVSYRPPAWATQLRHVPHDKITIGHFPTPIYPFRPPGLPDDINLFIKRDDYSGIETSGNKARKLEFLLADALDQGADCVVTCGGIQSNHCRATAVAARMLGLDSYLLLRTAFPEDDPGLVGNLMLKRLVGAQLLLLSRQEYGKYGSEAMIQRTCEKLRVQGRKPYAIPVGGSNGLGTWGYLDAVEEIYQQLEEMSQDISDVVFACGSGGSAAGMGLGFYLHSKNTPETSRKLNYRDGIPAHGYSVCDSPKYFHKFINEKVINEMGIDPDSGITSEDFIQFTDVKGIGYARNTEEEMDFIQSVALETGVILDPVYSGKALFGFIKEIQQFPEKFSGKNILFVHTGGLFGLYDKASMIEPKLPQHQVERFQM